MTDGTIAHTGSASGPTYRGASFGDALRSEWIKLRSLRSTFWALGASVVLGIGLGAAIAAASAHSYAGSSLSNKASWDPASLSTSGMAIGQLAIEVLGVLFIASEYSSGMIRTSLIVVPKRGRLLAAKSVVFATVTLVVGELTSFASFFVGQALISAHAPTASLHDAAVARAVIGAGLLLSALAVLAVAAGTLLRHSAAGIAAMIAVALVLPGIAQALPASLQNPINEFWPTAAGGQITNVYRSSHSLEPWAGLAVLCLFVAIVYTAAWLMLERRDA